MDDKHRERGNNWTAEEKEIFMEIMKESLVVTEDKITDTNSNKRKEAEWLKVQNKYQELTGKLRDVRQLKGFWRRTKIAAKKSISNHRRALRATGGGPPPPSPTEEIKTIMEMCPADFIEEKNEFDSDGIFETVNASQGINNGQMVTPKRKMLLDMEEEVADGNNPIIIEDIIIDDSNNEIITKQSTLNLFNEKENIEYHTPHKKLKMTPQLYKKPLDTKRHKSNASHKNILVESNKELKEKTFKLMEEEHNIKMKYQTQELCHQELKHKFEIEILMLEKEKKILELNILKKQLL